MREVSVSYRKDSQGNDVRVVTVTGASMISREPTAREREILDKMHQQWNSEIAAKQREEAEDAKNEPAA